MSENNSKVVVPPNSKDSEMMVLGCMLTNVNSLNAAADALDDSDFYYTEHKILFGALKSAYKNDKPADVHLICEELKRIDKLKSVGGIAFVTSVAQYAGTSAYIEEYIDLIKNKSILRRMISTSQDIEKKALQEPDDVANALDEAQQRFFAISQVANPLGGVHIKDLISGAKAESNLPFLKELQDRQELFKTKGAQDIGITGIATHFIDLDKMLNGFNNSNLMILAARPAMGKTALALNIAENVCFKNQIPVGIFSLEMSAEQLLHRLVCSQAEVESEKIKNGSLGGVEFQKIVAAVNMMQKSTMIIDDQPGLKITDLRSRARRMKESHGIAMLIIDYLQLLSGSGFSRNAENRQNEISEISRMLKTLARELNIPILCLSQLSRKVEDRAGHRPMMSDLRESGCLTGDTIIRDAKTGKVYTIKELADRKVQTPITVHAINEDRTLGEHRMIKAFYSGKKVVYELKTRSGRSIKASGNHPFIKLGGWIPLEKLMVNDKIAIAYDLCERAYPEVRALSAALEFNSNTSQSPALLEAPTYTQTSDVYWDEILSITELGVEDVYDATVEKVHNFVANDIIVHNSIEQDADIVMFLLRREYYDPYDKPGLAELIVAKNRHGGVGNINMTFRKELAQFANYSPGLMNAGKDSNEEAFAAFAPRPAKPSMDED